MIKSPSQSTLSLGLTGCFQMQLHLSAFSRSSSFASVFKFSLKLIQFNSRMRSARICRVNKPQQRYPIRRSANKSEIEAGQRPGPRWHRAAPPPPPRRCDAMLDAKITNTILVSLQVYLLHGVGMNSTYNLKIKIP